MDVTSSMASVARYGNRAYGKSSHGVPRGGACLPPSTLLRYLLPTRYLPTYLVVTALCPYPPCYSKSHGTCKKSADNESQPDLVLAGGPSQTSCTQSESHGRTSGQVQLCSDKQTCAREQTLGRHVPMYVDVGWEKSRTRID